MSIVHLRVPAEPAFVGVLRNLVTSLSAQTNLGVDVILELQEGINEAFIIVTAHKPESGDVFCEFDITGDALSVRVTGPANGELPDTNNFNWLILSATTRDPEVSRAEDGSITVTIHSPVVASA